MKKLWKEENGSILVLTTICLTVIIGMAGFAVDYGKLASTKQDMQNAVDAAALAGAMDLGNKLTFTTIRSTSSSYLNVNGYEEDGNTNFEVSVLGDTVTVKVQKEVNVGFSAVLTHKNTQTVVAEATAEVTSIFGTGPYSMFAGQKIEDGGDGITINGNNIYIDGNIHSNSDINMPKAVLASGSVATAVGNTSPSSSGWNKGAITLDMPSYKSLKNAVTSTCKQVTFDSSVKKNSKTGFQELINEAVSKYQTKYGGQGYKTQGLYIYINGDLTFNGNSSTAYNAEFPIILTVKGDINLNGATLNSTEACPIDVISETGSIEVNGGGAEFFGLVYAPNGDVTINGNNANFVGSIYAQNIYKNGGKINVTYHDCADAFLPKSKVHLIN